MPRRWLGSQTVHMSVYMRFRGLFSNFGCLDYVLSGKIRRKSDFSRQMSDCFRPEGAAWMLSPTRSGYSGPSFRVPELRGTLEHEKTSSFPEY